MTALRKILLLDDDQRFKDAIRLAAPDANIVMTTEPADIDREIVDADMTIGGPLTDQQIQSARNLKWHHVPWVGVERIVTPAMAEKGITLTNGSGVNSENIAEHVVALMLAFARDLPRFIRDQDRSAWRDWVNGSPRFFEIGGQSVVCLGTGDIGQEVARRLGAFGCEIVGASRSGRDVPRFDRCVSFEHLEAELALADHVINCLPLTDATRGIVDGARFGQMKPGAYFYNVGRGGTVDQEALITALGEGYLAGAGLDVVTPEPLPSDSPLWAMHNVIITSHTSGNSPMANQRMGELITAQIQRYLAGEPLLNALNMEAGY